MVIKSTYVLNEGALVLEGVTLGGVVQLVVQVLVDLARGTVLDQQAAENTLAAHPDDLPVSPPSQSPGSLSIILDVSPVWCSKL